MGDQKSTQGKKSDTENTAYVRNGLDVPSVGQAVRPFKLNDNLADRIHEVYKLEQHHISARDLSMARQKTEEKIKKQSKKAQMKLKAQSFNIFY